MSFSKFAIFFARSSLVAAIIFCLTASHCTSCVDKRIIVLALKRETTWMKPTHSLRNFVGGPGNVISIVVVNRDVPVCIMVRVGEKAWSAVDTWQVRVGQEEQWEYMQDGALGEGEGDMRIWKENGDANYFIQEMSRILESKFQINLTSSWQLNDGTGLRFWNGWHIPVSPLPLPQSLCYIPTKFWDDPPPPDTPFFFKGA